jgi:dolichyl-phosphate-mannose--protein O-mannosyl transferase
MMSLFFFAARVLVVSHDECLLHATRHGHQVSYMYVWIYVFVCIYILFFFAARGLNVSHDECLPLHATRHGHQGAPARVKDMMD